jgi:hypothetical protein
LYHDEDGHRWTYDVYTNECDDPSNCGSPVEQHWADRGEEPLPWLEEEEFSDNDEEEEFNILFLFLFSLKPNLI